LASGRGGLISPNERNSMSAINLLQQKMEVVDARKITVSDIVLDTDGNQVRSIRIFGDPTVSGSPAPFIEVVCRSANKIDLEIQAPGFKF